MVEDYVIFKSHPLHYYNERDGTKANTVRHIDEEDARFKLLREGKVKNIKIVNSVDGQSFIRPISNRTEWEGLMIISWSHYEPKKRWLKFMDAKELLRLPDKGGKHGN